MQADPSVRLSFSIIWALALGPWQTAEVALFFYFGEALSPAFALLAQNTQDSAVTR
jgi:hypothetical protein